MSKKWEDVKIIFKKYFDNQHNFMTPTVLKYGWHKNGLAWELSQGKRIERNGYIYGVTVLGVHKDNSVIKLDEMCDMFYGLKEAQAYIAELEKYVYNDGSWIK